MTFRTWAALAVAATAWGCDTGIGVDLTGLWIADTIEYRNYAGTTVDVIDRDGASMSLTVDLFIDGRRRVTTLFDDGTGATETMSGEVFVEERIFEFEDATFEFEREGRVLTLVNVDESFDFGAGPESATLTIRLTQL